jgi:hypothetical protein
MLCDLQPGLCAATISTAAAAIAATAAAATPAAAAHAATIAQPAATATIALAAAAAFAATAISCHALLLPHRSLLPRLVRKQNDGGSVRVQRHVPSQTRLRLLCD